MSKTVKELLKNEILKLNYAYEVVLYKNKFETILQADEKEISELKAKQLTQKDFKHY
jgi:hypothetical protein